MIFYDWSTRKINFVMRLGTSIVMVLLLGGSLYWMYGDRIVGRQILGMAFPSLLSEDNRGFTISVEELEKCRGPIAGMLAGDKSVTVNGRRFARADDTDIAPMLVKRRDGIRTSLVPDVTRYYKSGDLAFIILETTDLGQLSLHWSPPLSRKFVLNLWLFRFEFRSGPTDATFY